MAVADAYRKLGISEQTFYRWKKQYEKLEIDQVRQLKQLQEENQRLKRLVANLTLDKTMLQDVLAVGNDIDWLPMRAAGLSLVISDITMSGA